MTRGRNELPIRVPAYVFLHRMRADLRNLPINHRGELVDHHEIAALKQMSREINTEFLAG
jgi:hypothetical protein